ncbi:carboxymuconolactone decarboxylase family protein [Embleya scabrispora]|uniref:carboxymuconolactone decarboxylase family protein n=1 Tax=Embleya scabrispora TaxID=159449 RepID=UPI00036CD26A|nr:carboxymuconolactone decarboxylase family protein [Embleya scabrispora]MYS86363.1 carboxymuconolactone decarboxylase family protein [Streptomyces sp. SID5474]
MSSERRTDRPAEADLEPHPRPDPGAVRVDFARAAPKAFKSLIGFDVAAREGLDPALVELVQVRASQLNGCAYCLHMHWTDAHKAGAGDERLALVALWRNAPHLFTEREQAALALTEALTLVAADGVPDHVYARAADRFDECELARLMALILTINTWNRIAIGTGKVAGTDERGKQR